MTILVVVAHPDDEALGCGATIAHLTARGAEARACFLSGEVDVRRHRPEVPDLHADACKAAQILGMDEPIFGPFPNIRMNTVATYELVQFIEDALRKTRADTIFTHNPGDLNDDHLHVARATHAAARLWQRGHDVPPLRALYHMEVLSSTEWSVPGAMPPFQPDTFSPVNEEEFRKKLEALAAYRGVMREAPHPRSEPVLRALAICRGSQAGVALAEAFHTAFRLLAGEPL